MGERVCTAPLPSIVGLLYGMALFLRVGRIRRQLCRHHRQHGERLCLNLPSRSADRRSCHRPWMVFHTRGVDLADPGISVQYHNGQVARPARKGCAYRPYLSCRSRRRRLVVPIANCARRRCDVDIQQWRKCKFVCESIPSEGRRELNRV